MIKAYMICFQVLLTDIVATLDLTLLQTNYIESYLMGKSWVRKTVPT